MVNIVSGVLVIAGFLVAGAAVFYGGSYLVLYCVGVLFPLRRDRSGPKAWRPPAPPCSSTGSKTPSPQQHSPRRVQQALEYLRTTDLASVLIGRHDVDGDRIFALVQEYTTRPAHECRWEAHRKYIDVQHVVRGVERMGYAHIADVREREPYDLDRDVAFFEPGGDYVTVRAGMFTVFWPHDVHAPQSAIGTPGRPVRKVVVKVAVEER